MFQLLAPTVLVFGLINPMGWFLFSLGLQVRSLILALIIAPLVLTACFIGLPYGPTGVAFAYSTALLLWLIPHLVWCVHGTMLTPRDLAIAVGPSLIAGVGGRDSRLGRPSLDHRLLFADCQAHAGSLRYFRVVLLHAAVRAGTKGNVFRSC